jgi:hypothetical protein
MYILYLEADNETGPYADDRDTKGRRSYKLIMSSSVAADNRWDLEDLQSDTVRYL